MHEAPPLLGQVVADRYHVMRVLGEGGMGIVYAADDVQLARQVAIKVLFADRMKSSVAMKRFFRESKTIASLHIPQVCKIFDYGTLETGEPYFVMELLNGETLRDRLQRERALSIEDTIGILVELLGALAAAHATGVIHRDVKPENIFLTRQPDGTVMLKLIDFGIAKLQSGDRNAEGYEEETGSLTRTGTVVGTMWYVSPEQARGVEIDARVDVWACGILFYEMMTGRKPFDADRVIRLIAKIVKGSYPPASNFREIPPMFTRVLEKALARSREDRYADASEFRQALITAWTEYVTPEDASEKLDITRPRGQDKALTATPYDIPIDFVTEVDNKTTIESESIYKIDDDPESEPTKTEPAKKWPAP